MGFTCAVMGARFMTSSLILEKFVPQEYLIIVRMLTDIVVSNNNLVKTIDFRI